MFIAIIGTRSSGKKSVKDYLISKGGFTSVSLDPHGVDKWYAQQQIGAEDSGLFSPGENARSLQKQDTDEMPEIKSAQSSPVEGAEGPSNLLFWSPAQLLDWITERWEENFVTTDLNTKELVEFYMKRPYFLLVSLDAPLVQRFQRSTKQGREQTLEQFVLEDDYIVFGQLSLPLQPGVPTVALRRIRSLVNVHVANTFNTFSELHSHLDAIDLLDPERIRPGWDTYFMTLASLASRRSNCMKRRVGAVLVREKRIVSTGYNGTPRWLKNCNEGGCGPCNKRLPPGEKRECICLHAEENAISEAGRERVGAGAVLYCNTCPCERCTIKIIQSGVKEVVYNLEYKVDKHSATLFAEAGVLLRKHAPPVDD